ncbi:MAG: hypothetical protein Q7U04_02650 [Bacteriovorax sp.]|nr:hypothetical protein [Bacteriovorax sp.]
MKVFTSNKAIITFLSVSSIVLAGTINDFNSRSTKLHKSESIEKEIIPIERSVASETVSKVAQLYLPTNAINLNKINATWEITRIVGSDELVAFDKFANPEDSKKSIKVPLELIGNGIVRVNKDSEQVYRVSLLSDFGTIALYKKMGNGYEIIEARKIAATKENISLVVSDEVELVLERALNQAKSNKVLDGNDVLGQVTLNNKAIVGLAVELRNSNGETQSIEIDTADLMDGGTFKADVAGEEVSGVVLNNGKDGYRISFVTGPIAGAMLNFVTKEQMEKADEVAKDEQAENQDAIQAAEISAATEIVVDERKELARNEEERILNAEEVKQTAEEKGFSF